MVRVLPYLRCPVCGKVSLLRSFAVFHEVDTLTCSTSGLGRGRGFRNVWKKSPVQGNLIAWWIKRLKEVITYLERLQGGERLLMTKEVLLHQEPIRLANSNVVSEISVSTCLPMGKKSLSPLTKAQTLSVLNPSLSFSCEVRRKSGSTSKTR
jgi:hypothetical protein